MMKAVAMLAICKAAGRTDYSDKTTDGSWFATRGYKFYFFDNVYRY